MGWPRMLIVCVFIFSVASAANIKREDLTDKELKILKYLLSNWPNSVDTSEEDSRPTYIDDKKPTCNVSAWSDWTECPLSEECFGSRSLSRSYKARSFKATSTSNQGSVVMQEIVAQKLSTWNHAATCIQQKTCPERTMKLPPGYFQCNSEGLAGGMPCKNVDQMSFLSFVDMGYDKRKVGEYLTQGNDIWGWTDPVTNDEYAIMGLTGGTAFVRITDPRNPVPLGILYTATRRSDWRDIKVVGNHAYIVSEAIGHGLQVFDLTRLRGKTQIETFEADAVNQEFGDAHNIVANEETKTVYVVGSGYQEHQPYCWGGLMAFDVSNPLKPKVVACYGDDGYTHDAQCVIYRGPDCKYRGREICFAYNQDRLTILDMTDKSNIIQLSRTYYEGSKYTHQGWLTENHKVLIMDDEHDEFKTSDKNTRTFIWDIKKLTNPQVKSVYRSTDTAIDHNLYIKGNYCFQANYEAGLKILRIDEKNFDLTPVAYFDVYPSSTEAQFHGAWSVYPYYNSGTVVVSSIEYGLFVLKPDWAKIENFQGKMINQQKRTRSIVSAEEGAECPALEESRDCPTTSEC